MDFERFRESVISSMGEFPDKSFIIKKGTGKIMFSAPHSVEQLRNGKIKASEPQTALLCEMLHKKFGCSVIRKTANCNDDANYDPVSEYRDELVKYIKENNIRFLVDFHQLSPFREVMINFGTGVRKNLDDLEILNIFLSSFSKNKVGLIQIDEPFAGAYEHTVSSTVARECLIPAIQIEINSALLDEKHSEYSFEAVFEALCECYNRLCEIYGEE